MSSLWKLAHSFCAAQELSERHSPSGCNGQFDSSAQSIQQYLQECTQKVEAARTDLAGQHRAWIVEGNSPFMLRPERNTAPVRGILMVHGLADSPFLMRDIAGYFQQRDFHVLAMQLPGHGTRPGDLLEIRWQDWLAAQKRVLDLLAREVDELYLLGFSLGAVLNLYQALRDARIRGLFLFSPAIRIRHLAKMACPLARLGRRWKRLAWFDIQPDSNLFKYESLANRAICEVDRLIEATNRLQSLTELKVPVFVAASEDDVTVDTKAVLRWFAKLNLPRKRMLYYSTGSPGVPAQVRVINSRLIAQRIQSFSHTSLLNHPDNPHYGVHGAHTFCTHYYRLNPDKYRICKARQEDCLGEMFGDTPACQVIRRLTYNPLFEDLLDELDLFIKDLRPPGR